MRTWLRASVCVVGLGIVSGCGGLSINSAPVIAARTADATAAALNIADATGAMLADLPLDDATKDRYDCALLAVTGTPMPASQAVVDVCGPVPVASDTPLRRALTSLATVGSCPEVGALVQEVMRWASPLVTMLEESENAALRMAGVSLRASVAFLSGGFTCQP